jgi:hypothetical protein
VNAPLNPCLKRFRKAFIKQSVIASGAKQSRVFVTDCGLLRFARNDPTGSLWIATSLHCAPVLAMTVLSIKNETTPTSEAGVAPPAGAGW